MDENNDKILGFKVLSYIFIGMGFILSFIGFKNYPVFTIVDIFIIGMGLAASVLLVITCIKKIRALQNK